MSRPLQWSRFGRRFARTTGSLELMRDLGFATASGAAALPLGGGNPARIPAVEEVYRRELARIAADPAAFARFAEYYSTPEGDRSFRAAVARHLGAALAVELDADHVALTAGSQAAFFLLFNLLAGEMPGGGRRRILLSVVPEYIGYGDLGVDGPIFTANRPHIDLQDDGYFKYRIDAGELRIDDSIAAVCVSRPTNPTGNVLTAAEMLTLDRLARSAGVPLIIDSACGQPYPGIVFAEARPFWNSNVVLCLSPSKLGLPAVRAGIVVARPELIDALRAMSAVTSLAPPSTGPVLVERLVASGEIDRLAVDVIAPYYRVRLQQALEWLRAALAGVDFRIHRPEGAFFLWLWFAGLPITTAELYERLKVRGVLIVPGEYFFPGLEDDDWVHKHECLRLSYAQAPQAVERGIAIIGEEIRALVRRPR
jgi:valine--pyruvate aminotransferase